MVTIIHLIIVYLAIIIGDIQPIFNIIGSLSANAISYTIPAIFFIKLSKKKDIYLFLSYIIFIISILLGIFCVIAEQI